MSPWLVANSGACAGVSPLGNFRLPFDAEPETVESRIDARDRAGRERAVDPRYNVALEASAGTGKTRVLVDRYVNLLRAGVDPSNILAITFTRKAAAEMRERIVSTLRTAASRGEIAPARWRDLRDRTADIAISTIDAFCLSLLREFPLEADLDPGFSVADETEVPRLVDESLDRALRACRSLAREDEHVALVFAQLGGRRARAGLAALLNRRVVAPRVLSDYLARGPRVLDTAATSRAAAAAVLGVFHGMRGGLGRFLASGPPEPAFLVLARSLQKMAGALETGAAIDPASVQALFARLREHFLTQEGQPRTKLVHPKARFTMEEHWRTHRDLVVDHAPAVQQAFLRYKRDLNVLVSRGIWRMFRVAETEYRRTLDAHAVLDFADVLLRALDLLRQMEEFAQSRYRLESRYHHVLVDEFQDTSRAQWELVSLLIQSWGEGVGLAHSGPLQPSIFIVGDRKQSIYGFRDADVSVLQEAACHLESLRPDGDVRRSISRSFRSGPGLLAFANDICQDMDKSDARRDAFVYDEQDRFPIDTPPTADQSECLGVVLGDTPEACAEATADEIERLIAAGTTVRDRETGVHRPVRAGDIAILFRTRESHREYEGALEQRGISAYVYKGLGFFDADEIKDTLALLCYLADPLSDLRAAAFMRSRFARISDEGLRRLAPRLADALRSAAPPAAGDSLSAEDVVALAQGRAATLRWRGLVDRLPPAELLDRILNESAYAVEMRGPRFPQARENLKKMRALVRRIQNRGYLTLGRIAAHLDRLAVGDEANAVIDALDAVNLMTVHASKGLEFPIVFLVNLARGTGSRRDPIRVAADPGGESPSVAVGDYQSDADEDVARRETEETKRLLYVAVTRARDRLYLGTGLKDGRIEPGRGSLAEVLPASLLTQLTPSRTIEWHASSGHVHRFRVCEAGGAGRARGAGEAGRAGGASGADVIRTDFGLLTDVGPTRHVIAAAIGGDVDARSAADGRDSDRLVGTLVHRLVQTLGPGADSNLARGRVAQLIRPEELVDCGVGLEPEATLDAAVVAYEVLSRDQTVGLVYSSGEALHEVPFTMHMEGAWLRGSIDCLVCDRTGLITVLEFKTGRPRPEHHAQVELYRRAAERMFPGQRVEARVVYADDGQLARSRQQAAESRQ
ncbi:MAG TPA: UvrD-helicase domain-containing protein [Vicinamibacterales bacterium]